MSAPLAFGRFAKPFLWEATMNLPVRLRRLLLLSLLCSLPLAARADVPSFITRDSRLPNPDRPYVMEHGSVEFLQARDMNLYDLEFQALDARQLDSPTENRESNWVFDSKYDIAYEAQVSFGDGPTHRVIGRGSAHVRGIAPGGIYGVYDTELLDLDLRGLSSRPDGDFLFRESPTLRSSGKTIIEDGCPVCDSIFPIYKVSSFLEIFAEASADGGQTWAPGDSAIRVVQQARPAVHGDYNQNGTVDAADYVIWRKLLGPGALENEGGVSNNLVDEADYKFWRSQFGARAEERFFVSPNASAVPEPAAFLLLTIGALATPCRRGRKKLDAR
jgi:hypothetical protein